MLALFLSFSFLSIGLVGLVGYFWPAALWVYVVLVPIVLIGFADLLQYKHGIRRNFPLIGNLRYLFELIRPELQQYFVESNHSGRPIPREFRSIVYQRSKYELQSLPFGTQRDVYGESHEWVCHSVRPVVVHLDDIRVKVGGPLCKQPYSASLFNVSAMSYGALSKNAVEALNLGAKKGGFFHNTGEGGISPYHLLGGDVVWQLGTAYFGCRTPEGRFCLETFQQKACLPQVKMIEVKLSQGAKPGKGGLLPGAKVSSEISAIRGVSVGKDVVSPPYHKEFSTPIELLQFIQRLREGSDGKPIGFKLCVGRPAEFVSICKAMLKTQIYPDYITVDGAEGGTGAAPLEFANSVGTPLEEGLVFVNDTLVGFGLRDKIKIIAAGKIFTSFHLLTKIALGADMVNSGRGMMLALGCIQALQCNTNRCPAGVATNHPQLMRGLHVPTKAERVYRYHRETVHAFAELLGAMGYTCASQIKRSDVYRRLGDGVIKTYEDLFPQVKNGAYLEAGSFPEGLSKEVESALHFAQAESFS